MYTKQNLPRRKPKHIENSAMNYVMLYNVRILIVAAYYSAAKNCVKFPWLNSLVKFPWLNFLSTKTIPFTLLCQS